MAYAEKRGTGANTYYLARYKDGNGRYVTVKHDDGSAVRYTRKLKAEQAGDAKEVEVRAGRWKDPAAGQITFAEWSNLWYAHQDLARSTMQNMKHHLQEHLLPAFEADLLTDIDPGGVDDWEKAEREAGYAPASIATWRGTLHVILEDAVDGREVDKILGRRTRQGLIDFNPATKRRGRGRRAGRRSDRGPEKVITDSLGVLLVAERAALLSGRDDEFVLVLTEYYTGMRWAELIGLETQYVRLRSVRVEQQLWEDDRGQFHLVPPKDDSYRDIDIPPFLSTLLARHVARTAPTPCACHGKRFVFSGRGRARPVGVAAVARRAGVSAGTVSTVLNHPERVAAATRARVEAVLGEVEAEEGEGAPHWRRSGFATWVFDPAASGWFPKKAPQPRRPVPVRAEPWPGVPVRGRNAQGRAEACWMPIATGLTRHGLRHAAKTLLNELRIDNKYKDEILGHLDGSVQARYSHVTEKMRTELIDALTEEWEAALDARLELCPTSPVRVLDELLSARSAQMEMGRPEDRPTKFPQGQVLALHSRPRKRA
ncbi:MAG: LacI family DNA-binding transcriptional regulator [Actinoallomurus sp.]